jgi:hypothetical protein
MQRDWVKQSGNNTDDEDDCTISSPMTKAGREQRQASTPSLQDQKSEVGIDGIYCASDEVLCLKGDPSTIKSWPIKEDGKNQRVFWAPNKKRDQELACEVTSTRMQRDWAKQSGNNSDDEDDSTSEDSPTLFSSLFPLYVFVFDLCMFHICYVIWAVYSLSQDFLKPMFQLCVHVVLFLLSSFLYSV